MRPSATALVCLLQLLCAGASADEEKRVGPWQRLLRYDGDQDGRVSAAEHPGPRHAFLDLDADRDGFVTREEAVAKFGRGDENGRRPSWRLDLDRDGVVSPDEWRRFRQVADFNRDGIVENVEFDSALRGLPPADSAPRAGDPAPKLKLRTPGRDGKAVDLSRPARPTVLILSSWT